MAADPNRFNEAAADDRGKHAAGPPRAIDAVGFNEAAADDRGKLTPGRLRPRPGNSLQ